MTACTADPGTTAKAAPVAVEAEKKAVGAVGGDVAAEGGGVDDPGAHECSLQGTYVVDTLAMNAEIRPADLLTEADRDQLAPGEVPKFDAADFAKIYLPPGRTVALQDYVTTTFEERAGRKLTQLMETPGHATQSGISATTEADGKVRLDWHMTPSDGGCQGGQSPSRNLLTEPAGPLAKFGKPAANAISTVLATVAGGITINVVGGLMRTNKRLAPLSGCVASGLAAGVYSYLKAGLYSGDFNTAVLAENASNIFAGCGLGAAAGVDKYTAEGTKQAMTWLASHLPGFRTAELAVVRPMIEDQATRVAEALELAARPR